MYESIRSRRLADMPTLSAFAIVKSDSAACWCAPARITAAINAVANTDQCCRRAIISSNPLHVVPDNPLKNRRRLVLTLAFDSDLPRHLNGTVRDDFDGAWRETPAQSGMHRNCRDEPHPIDAVVDRHLHAKGHRCSQEDAHQRERQKPVRNRRLVG